MDPQLAQAIEIETIAELLPELTYYQILQVDSLAPTDVIEKAYRGRPAASTPTASRRAKRGDDDSPTRSTVQSWRHGRP